MKKLSALIVILVLILSPLAFSEKGEEKGACEAALKNASDEAIFNRASDWFATIGKSGEEKEAALAERKLARAKKRAEKEAAKAQKQAQKEAKKAEKAAKDAMDKASGDAKKGFGALKDKLKKKEK